MNNRQPIQEKDRSRHQKNHVIDAITNDSSLFSCIAYNILYFGHRRQPPCHQILSGRPEIFLHQQHNTIINISSSLTTPNLKMQGLVSASFSAKSESDGEFKDSSRSACDVVHKTATENYVPQRKQESLRCRSRFRPSVVFLLLAFLLGVSTRNHPLLFAEARASTGAITTFSPTKSKAFINRSPTPQVNPLYAFGNFGHEPKHVCLARRFEARICRLVDEAKDALMIRWERFLADLTISKVFGWALRAGRTWVFWFFSKDCLASIYEDRWHAERDPDKFFGSEGMWISNGAHKDVVKRRIQRSRRNRQWVGLGYTPR